MDKGIIKKLNTSELKGWEGQEGMDVYPVTSTDAVFDSSNKSLTDILEDLGTNSTGVPVTVSTKLLQVYKTATAQPVMPSGGSYDFTSKTFTAPDGWHSSSEGLDNPIWMSYGSAASNNDSIAWSVPVCISGSTVSTTTVKAYVAVVYKNAATKPDTPTGGSYDFSSKTLTPPDGWSKDSEVAVNEETWCSIGAFYSDGRDVVWSEPSKTAQANVSISAAQIETIAGKISLTANELSYIVDNVKLTASQLEYIASNMTLTSDQLKIISNSVDITGTLNTTDLTINGGASQFNADGSGYVASKAVQWDSDGNTTYTGVFTAGTGATVITMSASDGSGYLKLGDYMELSYGTSSTFSSSGEQTFQGGKLTLSSTDGTSTVLTSNYLSTSNIRATGMVEGCFRPHIAYINDDTTVGLSSSGKLTIDGTECEYGTVFVCSNSSSKAITLPQGTDLEAFYLAYYKFIILDAAIVFTVTNLKYKGSTVNSYTSGSDGVVLTFYNCGAYWGMEIG